MSGNNSNSSSSSSRNNGNGNSGSSSSSSSSAARRQRHSTTTNNHNNHTHHNNNINSNQRQRTNLIPLDSSLINQPVITDLKEVGVNDLIGEKVFDIDLDDQYIDVQLLRIITPNTDQKAHIYSIRRARGTNNNNSSEVHFSRIYQCRIYSEKNLNDHSQLLYLMESRNSNQSLFDRNLEYRDNGTITIGSFLRIIAPQEIENHMNGGVPLVRTPHPFIVMKRPNHLSSVQISRDIQSNASMAFVLNNRTLHVNQVSILQTTCCGNMCDKQRANDWNGIRGCGCIGMSPTISGLTFVHRVWIEAECNNEEEMQVQKNRIKHDNFSSTKFSLCYLSDRIPSSTRVSQLQTTKQYYDVKKCIQNIVQHINDNGGWTIVGWYKRGCIKDKSLLEVANQSSNNQSSESTMVGAGQLNYHMVEILPTDRDFLDRRTTKGMELHTLKYQVSNLNE